jgi:hypothetical protein
MRRRPDNPVKFFGVPHLLSLVFFCYAASQYYFGGARQLNWVGSVLEGLGFVLLARSGRTALRDLWLVSIGRTGMLFIVTGAVLTPLLTH